MGKLYTFVNVFYHLFLKPAKSFSYIRHILNSDFFEQRCQLSKSCISRIIEPWFNEYSVLWLKLEIFSNVVYNYFSL